jgi:hypothetical protein
VGLALDFAGFNAVKMLFWSAILNRLLAPPLVVMVVLLTSDRKVMGSRANSRAMKALGWTCAAVMSVSAAALLASFPQATEVGFLRKGLGYFFFFGTLAPFFRASDNPIAMACFLLFTRPPFPALPDRKVPFFLRCIALFTDFRAVLLDFAIVFLLSSA